MESANIDVSINLQVIKPYGTLDKVHNLCEFKLLKLAKLENLFSKY